MKSMAVALMALSMATSIPAHAADDGALPKVHKQGGSTYISGGAREDQRTAMLKAAPRYPIQLIFYTASGQGDMSQVKVTMRNVSGDSIVEARSEGPHFYINPPASGRYTFEVEYQGEKKSVTKDLVGRRYLVLEFKFGES